MAGISAVTLIIAVTLCRPRAQGWVLRSYILQIKEPCPDGKESAYEFISLRSISHSLLPNALLRMSNVETTALTATRDRRLQWEAAAIKGAAWFGSPIHRLKHCSHRKETRPVDA